MLSNIIATIWSFLHANQKPWQYNSHRHSTLAIPTTSRARLLGTVVLRSARVGLESVPAEGRVGTVLRLVGLVLAVFARKIEVYVGVRDSEAEDGALVKICQSISSAASRGPSRQRDTQQHSPDHSIISLERLNGPREGFLRADEAGAMEAEVGTVLDALDVVVIVHAVDGPLGDEIRCL